VTGLVDRASLAAIVSGLELPVAADRVFLNRMGLNSGIATNSVSLPPRSMHLAPGPEMKSRNQEQCHISGDV
jgi:hypothetical protein